MPLKDVGNGIQQFVPSTPAEDIAQAKDVYGLVELANRVDQQPLDMATKQADLQLKKNQVDQIPLANLKARTDLIVQQNQEFRNQSKFQADAMIDTHKAFAQDFSLGKAVTEKNFPGSIVTQSTNGLVNIALPMGQGRFRTVQIDPQMVADPKERIAIQDSRRKEWETTAKPYQVLSSNYENMGKLSALATGPADLGMVYAYNKMLDPNSAVREGEVLTAQNSPGLSEAMRNLYNRALETGAPMFGGANSTARKSFLDAASVLKETAKQNLIQQGQNAFNTATEERLNPKAIISPFADVNYATITGQTRDAVADKSAPKQGQAAPKTVPAAQTAPANPRRPLPEEAGIVPTGDGKQPPAPKVNFNDELNAWKQSVMGTKKNARQ